jgi:sec-independent protein translocase protein TatB
MFGMGGSEIIVILIVALLFLGPDKLPQAAKSISKGIRDIKKQSRALQQQIESDEQIGGAIRDLKSALRGEDLPVRPRPFTPRPQPQLAEGTVVAGATAAAADGAEATAAGDAPASDAAGPALTLPETAGEADPISDPVSDPDAGAASGGDADLASMIKPAPGTVAKGS